MELRRHVARRNVNWRTLSQPDFRSLDQLRGNPGSECLTEQEDDLADPYLQVRHGVFALLAIAVAAISAYVFLCGWSLFEAVYMVITTIATVGYGEIRHESWLDRSVNVFVIVTGITAAAYTFGGLLQLVNEAQVRRLATRQPQMRKIEQLNEHVVICGFGRMGKMICEDLQRRGVAFVLIEQDPARVALADQAGFLVVQGDATLEEFLTKAGIERARSIVCALPSDADNVFVTLTAREMNEKLFITARAEQLSTEKKLKQAGADRVVAPHVIGAQRITSLLTQPTTVEILELVTGRQSVDLEIGELVIPDGAAICGQTLGQAHIRSKTGVNVIAIRRADGTLLVSPGGDVLLYAKDTVVFLGRTESIEGFRKQFGL